MSRAITFHHRVGRRPIQMTVEQRADDAAVQHSRKGFLPLFGFKVGHDFITLREAANVQPLWIRRTTTEARVVRRVSFLKTLFAHLDFARSGAQLFAQLESLNFSSCSVGQLRYKNVLARPFKAR